MYLQYAVKTSYLILDRTDYKQKYASVCSNMYFCSKIKTVLIILFLVRFYNLYKINTLLPFLHLHHSSAFILACYLSYQYITMESSPKNVYTIPKTKHMEQITARAMSYSAVISSQVRGREIAWSPRVVPLTPSVEVGRVSYGCPGVAGGMARGAPTELVLMVTIWL